MLRLHARNPILLTAAALMIVVAAFAAMSSRFAPKTVSIESQPQVERVMVAPKLALVAPAATPAPTVAPEQAPQIARTGTIDVIVGNVDVVVTRIGELARIERGDVFALDAQSAGDGHGSQSASITVRIPASRFDETMNRLAAFGTVRARSVKAEDLSSNITDSSARLRNLRRTEADMLKIMDRSGRVGEIMDVENQLSNVREQIETLQAEVQSMRGRVAYSTIDITLQAEAKSAPVEPDALTQLKNVFAAAAHSLADTTIALIAACIWIAVFAPYAIAIALAVWALRLGLRKYPVRR